MTHESRSPLARAGFLARAMFRETIAAAVTMHVTRSRQPWLLFSPIRWTCRWVGLYLWLELIACPYARQFYWDGMKLAGKQTRLYRKVARQTSSGL